MNEIKGKIRVVWLCHFSNEQIHNCLDLGDGWLKGIIRKVVRKPLNAIVPDFAVWITNGIREIEKIDDVELHVVSPYPYLKNQIQELELNGVYYHFFHNEDEDLIKQLFHSGTRKYRKNRRTIAHLIKTINPDIVHLIGAENPHYCLGLLDVPKKIPTIVQLQTLLNDPLMRMNYPELSFLADVERTIIGKADYVGTMANKYREVIKTDICPSAIILNTSLALMEPLFVDQCEKQYDFVYFSANINKAADLALEAFGKAYQKNSSITLDIIGGYDAGFKQQLDDIINRYGISKAVVFEGSLLTHDDVLRQIRKARFALLPLKTDLTSGTIREAMSSGLPVVTTDTGELGTLKLNQTRQSVLISRIGDHQALADNMLRLLKDGAIADALRQNAYKTRSEMKSNEMVIRKYIEAYRACIDNHKNGTLIPESLTKI